MLIILSGPEPQRSILENKIIKDIAHYEGTATVLRGLPGLILIIPSTNTIKFYNHLPAEELNKEMHKAEYVICRSGYSTIMDIMTLAEKKYFDSYARTNRAGVSGKISFRKKDCPVCSAKKFFFHQHCKIGKSFL